MQGLVTGIGTAFGMSVTGPTQNQINSKPLQAPVEVQAAPSPTPQIDLGPLLKRMDDLESSVNKRMGNLESSLTQLVQSQVQTNASLNSFMNAQAKTNAQMAVILQALTPSGSNYVYMAAWYNGQQHATFDISQFEYSTDSMLNYFWKHLIENNKERICYFHNFGGYDSILSLPQLLSVNPNYSYNPIMKDGELISLDIIQGTRHLLSIKDSIRILPSSLSKLAKDYKVSTQKDHFPHYFYLNSIKETIKYEGSLPTYSCFEPKRTSPNEYQVMVNEFSNRTWSFLAVSKQYIMGDCIALYQILTTFFDTLVSKFPINPLDSLSVPSLAFKTWRTVQLPRLNEALLKVYDFSRTLDAKFREGYHGGIVDVYKPHLIGEGFYYDVNSLYPTAMCKSMPVGMPKTIDSFLYSDSFFGFIEATVTSSPDEYIGLLPIKQEGRLICPKGTFRGLFFSEELNFALQNGYKIDQIHHLYSFQRGVNCFRDLIEKVNAMKIEAQLNNQPTIRNIAKLLMNSMYGRFGMHTDATQSSIIPLNKIAEYAKIFNILSQIDFENFSLIHYSLDSSPQTGNPTFNKLIRQFHKGLPSRTNVAIASAVTAYSRMIINQHKLTALSQGLNLYYSDTDSLIVDGVLPSHLLDNAELGKLKLEHEIQEGIFVMPKVYYLLTSDNKEVLKAKGYPGKLTRSDYLALLKGETLQELLVNKWQRSKN